MNRPNRTTGGRRAVSVLLIAALFALGGVAAAPPSEARTYRARLLDMINHSREQRDLDAVRLNVRLSADARHHARRMVRQGRLFDVPNLPRLLKPYHWTKVGADVVGCGPSLFRVHRLLMGDPAHRDIIMSPDVRRVGIGVVHVHGKSACGRDAFWATEIFYG